ncbi:MAG: hypothetical protein IJ752_09410 [Alphaproteobacteria bacterium]|nr:hypothetical protein [Alphaproteobacteria bacterium]
MIRFRQIAVFLLVWLAVVPAVAAVAAPPGLSVVQRDKEIQLIFSWEKPVDFSEEKRDGRYFLSFPVQVTEPVGNLDQIRTALPAQWRQMRLTKGNKLTFSVVLPKNGRAQARKEGSFVFVSLSEGKDKRAPKTAKDDAKPKSEEKMSASSSQNTEDRPAFVAVAQEIIDDQEELTVPQLPVQVDLSLLPYKEAQTSISLTLSDPKIFDAKSSETSVLTLSQDTAGYRAATLSFPWSRMTGVAAFRRDGYLWIVFDRQGDFDFTLERELYKDIIYEMIQIPHSHATIYRLVTAKGYNPSLRREGLLWVVDLMYQPMRSRQPIDLILQRKTAFGARIFIPLDESPQVLPLIDPEVGDLMYIIPVFARGKGVPHARSFVDASFLQTAQGIVIIPNIEELNVYTSTSGIEVRGPKGGMRFSSEDILSFLAKTKIDTDPLSQILDAAAWGGGDQRNYINTLKTLQDNVLQANRENKDIQRLILARYYFANGMYPETLSVLRTISADNKKLADLPGLIALRGAANFMMMRYDEAIKDLSAPSLKDDMASEYWRAATLAASSRTPDVYLQPMKDNMAILQAYPQPIKTRLALAGLHAAVAGGDEFSIQNFMEAANNSENTAAENDEIAFYHALWQETTGMYSLAREEMTRLAEGKDLYFRAMGGLEKVRMDTRAKAITPQERIEELERLSYAWRGGEFEYNLMTMLVAAYQDQRDFAEVLHILKDMRARFNGMPESKNIQSLMEDIFRKLYLNDEENLLSPVKAVALYEEFKELTPPGEKGAQVIRRLADRLVAMDLLERAADLLDEQLKRPIGNKERGLVSTRLALVRLLNKEPEQALKALSVSEDKQFSEKLQKQRLYIRAKALADLKKTEEAAALLENDDSESAKMLRAEIFWQAQMWDKAADALKLLIKKPQPNVPLTAQEAQRVLDWAAALRLAGRPKIVMRLRENFMPYMKETPLFQAFDFITKTPQQGLMDYRQVAQEVESAESFHTFAKEYTNMIKTQGLSETVR